MPIVTGLPLPAEEEKPIAFELKDFPVPGAYRFTGYRPFLDDDGNIVIIIAYSDWQEPSTYNRPQAFRVAKFNLRP